jgi:hypothetical protein
LALLECLLQVLPLLFLLKTILVFPSEDAIDDILEYCESNPNGDITTGLVDTEEISEFYTDYTCEQAAGEKEWLDNDRDPDANTNSDDE